MADQQTPNPQRGEPSDDRENPTLNRLLERLRQINDANQDSPHEQGQQGRVAPPARPPQERDAPPRPAPPPFGPGQRFGQHPPFGARPSPRPPDPERQRAVKNAAPLPLNTRGETVAEQRRAKQAQARAARQATVEQVQRRATRAVDVSNQLADVLRAPLFLVGLFVAAVVMIFNPSDRPQSVSVQATVQTATPFLLASTIPTTTPAPEISPITESFSAAGSVPEQVIPAEPALPDDCKISALPLAVSTGTQATTQAPVLTVRALVSTIGCDGRALRVSLWINRADGQPMRAPAANSLYRTEAGLLTVQARVPVLDDAASPVVLELPYDQFPLAAGTHQITGYVNVRDWETHRSLHDVALEPFTLTIAP